MTTKAELEAAGDAWSQARRIAAYEHRALCLLMLARKETIEKDIDHVHVEDSALLKGTELYRKSLGQHVARVQLALEHLDKTAASLATIRTQYARQAEAPTRAVPPTDYVGWRQTSSHEKPGA